MGEGTHRKRLYSVEEAARLLSMGRTKTFAELKAGRLKSVKIGRARLIPAEYIDDFVELLKHEADCDKG
ncbi:helix-turn-helix domain-containing protein [Nocardiopsis sp. FR4]|uniref:helix-turn-helix domain-containing protein n=1 Tax=Nocardiopsis sp. FR4 TaxID=2605985 RepID=UPI001358F88C|nr:helix-turn-helix domain-containing protein [Nocardiopsis sp. FR4]